MQKCKLAGNMQVYHVTAKMQICKNIQHNPTNNWFKPLNTFSKAIFRIVNSLKIPFSKVFTVYN